MTERMPEIPESHRRGSGQDTISVSGRRVARQLLAILLIVLGVSILVFPLLHIGR